MLAKVIKLEKNTRKRQFCIVPRMKTCQQQVIEIKFKKNTIHWQSHLGIGIYWTWHIGTTIEKMYISKKTRIFKRKNFGIGIKVGHEKSGKKTC
jgi:hypothetical protein